jgi:hypothetical protein
MDAPIMMVKEMMLLWTWIHQGIYEDDDIIYGDAIKKMFNNTLI